MDKSLVAPSKTKTPFKFKSCSSPVWQHCRSVLPTSAAGGNATSTFIPGYPFPPVKSFPTGDSNFSSSLHFKESSSISISDSGPKSHLLTRQAKLCIGSSNPDHLGHQFHPSSLVNMDTVPKTQTSNKRLQEESPENIPIKKISYPNGQVVQRFHFMKACMPLQRNGHGEDSRDSVRGLSQGSSSCEAVPSHKEVPVMDLTLATATVTSSTTATTDPDPFTQTSICSTFTVADTITCTHITDTAADSTVLIGTTTFTTTVCSTTSTCTVTGFSTTPVLPPKKRQKKPLMLRRVCATSAHDILKEKMASKARMFKVKTTQELVASILDKPDSVSRNLPENKLANVPSSENKPSLAKCIFTSQGTPTDVLEISRKKTENTAKFCPSWSELHHIQENPSTAPTAEMENSRLQKYLGGPSINSGGDTYNSSPAEVPSLSKDIFQQSSSSKDLPSACAKVMNIQELTVEDILAQLPPTDVDAICWDDSMTTGTGSEAPVVEVMEDILRKLHMQHVENLNGNVNEGAHYSDSDNFCEWHEMVSKRSYQGQFLHILPYVIID